MICLGTSEELREKYNNGLEVFLQTVPAQVDQDLVTKLETERVDLLAMTTMHSEKRRLRFLSSGMALVGSAAALPFAQWWAQETLNDSVEASVQQSLRGVDTFDASGRSVRFVAMPPRGVVDLDFVGSVFATLSKLKKQGLVADFSLTQNSLDQVFRSVAARELDLASAGEV
jgi:hypothetical protein